MFVPISNTVVAGRYELIDEIGRGGMGVVWRARQTNLGIECAVKFIHASQAHEPEIRRRFVREARAAASLKSPNSVHILDVDEWQGTLFIAMELLGGESLEARLAREQALSPRLTLDIIEQVARGLNKAHAMRLVHRDLKPENIFLLDEDPLLVKILDFGIAKRIDASSGLHTTSGVLVGTPGYMSPEQADGGKEIDYRSDLWSLAVVAFRCLTGFAPFDGDGLGQVLVKVMTGPIPSPCSMRSSLPSRVDDWWFRVLQRDPAQRPPSATALASGLRDALACVLEPPGEVQRAPSTGAESLQPTLQPVSSGPTRRMHPLRRHLTSGAALLAVGGLLATGGVVAGRWMRPNPTTEPDARWSPEEASSEREAFTTVASERAALAGEGIAVAPVAASLDVKPETVAVPPGETGATLGRLAIESHGSTAPPAIALAAGGSAPLAREPRAPEPRPPASSALGAKPSEPKPSKPKPSEARPSVERSADAQRDDDARESDGPAEKRENDGRDGHEPAHDDREQEPPALNPGEPEPDVFRKPAAPRPAPADDPRLGF